MEIFALIPVKGFRNAKQRLSGVLGTAERGTLAEVMFRDVLREVARAPGLAGTFVVTGDDHVSRIARSLGAKVIRERVEKGETDAVEFARVELKKVGCEAVLIVPGDIPMVRASDIEKVVSQIPEGMGAPFALLVPSHDRMGTNALLLSPPDIIKLRFGYDSFTYHMGQLAAEGLPLRFMENERIALDIDEPKDLERFLSLDFDHGESNRVARGMFATQHEHKTRRSGGL
jgi:2-phospho-L-lactate guanylyltransferase